jgi:hypothetical protein
MRLAEAFINIFSAFCAKNSCIYSNIHGYSLLCNHYNIFLCMMGLTISDEETKKINIDENHK